MQNVYGEIIYAENSSGLWREMQGKTAGNMACSQERTDEDNIRIIYGLTGLTEHNEDIYKQKLIESKP